MDAWFCCSDDNPWAWCGHQSGCGVRRIKTTGDYQNHGYDQWSHNHGQSHSHDHSHGSHGTGRVVPPRVGFSKGSGAVSAKGAGSGKGKGAGGNWGGCGVLQPMFHAMMSVLAKGSGKAGGLRSFAPELRVWVGGLPPNNVSKELNMKLKEHMSLAGVPCLFAEVGKSGTGGAAFKTNSEALVACSTLNGSQFEGVTLHCDMWSRKT